MRANPVRSILVLSLLAVSLSGHAEAPAPTPTYVVSEARAPTYRMMGGKGRAQLLLNQTTGTTDLALSVLILEPGAAVPAHTHDASSETLYIQTGQVEMTIGGPETVTLNSNPSDADGWAEASWQTQKPNKKGQGGTTPGSYTASVTNVTASGYHWDGVTTNTTFSIQ